MDNDDRLITAIDNREGYDIEYYEALSYRGLENTSFYKESIKETDQKVLINALQGTILSGQSCR